MASRHSSSGSSIRIDRRLERLLERVPDQRVAEHVEGVEDQVAAVRPVQRPRLDEAEVGDQRAEVHAVLDAPDQVAVGRIRLEDHRRAGEPVAVDQHVDLVAVEEAAGGWHEGQRSASRPQRRGTPRRGPPDPASTSAR